VSPRLPARSSRRAASRGMTLVEVLMAVGIASGVITLVYISARDVTRTKARLEEDGDRLREAQMAIDRFTRDLRSSFLSAHKKPLQPIVDTAFAGEDDDPVDTVSMTTFTHVHRQWNANDSDQAEVTWLAIEDEQHPGMLHLGRRESALLDEKPLEGGSIQLVVHDIVGFDVQYYETERDEWVKTWDTTQATAQPNRLPSQVRVVLTLLDRHGGEMTLATQVPLEMLQPILLPGGFQ
jgi:type II secretion system protein J